MTIRRKLLLIVSLLIFSLLFMLAVLTFQFQRVTSLVANIQEQAVRQQAESLRMQAQLRDAEAVLYRFQIEGLPIYASEFEQFMAQYAASIEQFEGYSTTEREREWAAELTQSTVSINRLGEELIALQGEQLQDLEQFSNLEVLTHDLLTQIRLVNSDDADYQELVNQMALDLSQSFFAVSSFQALPDESEITVFKIGLFTFRFHYKQFETLNLTPSERQQVDMLAATVSQIDVVGNRLLNRRGIQREIFSQFVIETEQISQETIVNEIQPWASGRLAESEATLIDNLSRFLLITGIVSFISVTVALGIVLPNMRQITTSLTSLLDGAARVSIGDLSQRIEIQGGGELSQLSTTFNQMMEDLSQREQRLQRRIAELETLQSVSLDMTGLLEVQLVLETIVQSGRDLVDASEAHIYLCDEQGLSPRLRASAWRDEQRQERPLVPQLGGLIDTVVRSQRLEIINHAMDHPRYSDPHSHAYRIRSTAALPIARGDRLLGVFNIAFDNQDELRVGEIRALRLLADQAAVAIENARLYQTVAEKETNLSDLLQKLSLVQEEERRLIGLDLHDSLAQILMSANMHLNTCAALQEDGSVQAGRQELLLGRQRLREAIDEVEWVVSELRPTELEDFGLVDGLRHYILRVAEGEAWQVDFDIQIEQIRINSNIETAVFRIVQEALSNARKYAQTERIYFHLSQAYNAIRIKVQDFGIGFVYIPSSGRENEGTLGLVGMQERAELLGGELHIISELRQGTLITASIPMRWEPDKILTSGGANAISVLIVDDHQMVRDGLRNMLKTPGIRVIGEAKTGRHAVEEVGRLRPDVVLMDIRMPDMDGIEALNEMVGRKYTSRVIIFTSHQSTSYLLQAVSAGAAGFLLKNISREELIGAIRSVAAGQTRIEKSFFHKALRNLNDVDPMRNSVAAPSSEPESAAVLTPREKDVLQLLVEGMTYQTIGHTLGISTNTVKGYSKTIFQKLNVTDRTQAAVKALRLGLIQ